MASTQSERTTLTMAPPPAVGRVIGECFAASVLILILLPVFVLIALAIKVTSPGPVFYIHDRIGQGGRTFRFVKFRTMIRDADKMRDEVLGVPDEEMPERYRSDPRITKVGSILRRWSVDELPQLINIARGDMALVGPRPLLPSEIGLLAPQHHDRHLCRPGLTGLWQVSGRKETTWEERMDLDIQYVHSKSWRTDLVILRRTFGVVLRGDGAY